MTRKNEISRPVSEGTTSKMEVDVPWALVDGTGTLYAVIEALEQIES